MTFMVILTSVAWGKISLRKLTMTNVLILVSIISTGLLLAAETSASSSQLLILCHIGIAALIAAAVMMRRKNKF